jgi:hypothetical protein
VNSLDDTERCSHVEGRFGTREELPEVQVGLPKSWMLLIFLIHVIAGFLHDVTLGRIFVESASSPDFIDSVWR